ncbi:MAG: response regulator [Proteobacteria bacterium]|nr:response regulator [Pseudomonadota bacterium]
MEKYHILLVDDDKTILSVFSKSLQTMGYQVSTALGGQEAFDILSEAMFHLVITDLNMPGVNGIQVLQRCKTLYPECVAIILTGYGNLSSAVDALRLDADDYLLKPCDPDELFFRIERSLEKFEMKRKIKAYEGILTTCCVCKKFQDDTGKAPGKGEWLTIEQYLWKNTKLDISSGYCPDCAKKAMDELKAMGNKK